MDLDVKIRFIYDGTIPYSSYYGYYYWMIDDIKIYETLLYRMEINNPQVTIVNNSLDVDYSIIPLHQLNQNNLELKSNLINTGFQAIQNVELMVTLIKSDQALYILIIVPLQTLTPGDTMKHILNNFSPNLTGEYEINFYGSSDSINSTDTSTICIDVRYYF